MIILRDITLRRGSKLLLQDANVTIQPGQRLALIGANGCGKSSLFSLLLDELGADALAELSLRSQRVRLAEYHLRGLRNALKPPQRASREDIAAVLVKVCGPVGRLAGGQETQGEQYRSFHGDLT